MTEFRQRLLASTLLIGAAAFASPAFAQSAETNVQEETADVGDPAARLCIENPDSPQCAAEGTQIVVTGSRIASPTLTSASPLQIVDAQDIDDSGVVNVQEVLLENPVFGTPTLSRTNSNFLTSSVGVATVDLRNLGTDRTLVLVNGRRFVAGVPSTATVDLNTIPTQFIERIDILTGGASSIYGSDAVAGVVNIIYKDDFEGIEASGQIGIAERGDDARKQANLLMGANFDDGRGNVTVHLGYSDEGAVFTRNRERSAIDQFTCVGVAVAQGGCGTFQNGGDFFTPYRPFLSGFAPGGTIFTDTQALAVGPGGVLRANNTNGLVHVSDGVPATVRPCTVADPCVPNLALATGFNRSAYRTIAVPTERYLMALRGNYEITDNINAFLEGTFAKTRTKSVLEPYPLGSGDINPLTGQINIEARDADGNIIRNPFVQDAIFNDASDNDGDGLRDIYFIRRMADLGPRGNQADRTTYRVLTGLEGDVFTDWRWDIFYAFGETLESQRGGGQVNVLNFANALSVITDALGNPICASEIARAQGCQPADVFGGPLSISPQAAAYIAAPQSRTTRTTQKLAGANLSGQLFDPWGAGPVGLAIGTEYRKEFAEENNDALTEAGLNAGNAIPSTRGSFDVIEGYAELAVPILTEQPFFHLLEARGAVRVSDYSTVGTTYSWNYGLEWAPVPDIRLRAVMARATRAPNIGELFTPPTQTFPPGLIDPCLGVGPTGNAPSGALGDICRRDPGVQANIAANGVFTANPQDPQGISGFNQGNPNLREEKADTFTAGVVINPRSISWLRNFAFTVDYYKIEIEDAITITGRQTILNQCFIEGNEDFCQFIFRRPRPAGVNSAGSIEFVNSGGVNAAEFGHEGIDVTASFRQNLEDWGLFGNFNARVAWTHVLEAFTIPLPDADVNNFNREIGAPRNKVFGTASWSTDDWGITWRQTYIGPVFIRDESVPGTEFDYSDRVRVGPEMYSDVQFRFTPGDNYEFFFGVDNLFDNEPPPIISGLPGDDTGTETDAGTYDPIGRRYYAGARLKF